MKLTSTLSLFAALTIMLYMTIGQMGGIFIGISQARTQAAERMGTSPLSTLTLTSADLASGVASFTDDNEIRYKGHMYDIAAKTKQGGNLVMKVLRDDKEESLMSKLGDIMDFWTNAPAKSNKQPSAKQIVIKDFIPSCKFTFTSNPGLSRLAICRQSSYCESPMIAVIKSPPQLV